MEVQRAALWLLESLTPPMMSFFSIFSNGMFFECLSTFDLYAFTEKKRIFSDTMLLLALRKIVNTSFWLEKSSNKTGTSQVGAISKAQKAQNIFFGKKLEIFEKKFFRKMSHSAEKCKRGDPFWYINTHSVAKYQKTQRGDPLGTLKKFRKKVSQRRKKIERGGYETLVPSGLVCNV